jgi:hypothetical protein
LQDSTQWNYHFAYSMDGVNIQHQLPGSGQSTIESYFQVQGNNGWELCGVYRKHQRITFIFKQPGKVNTPYHWST